jgi:hypothetical protein
MKTLGERSWSFAIVARSGGNCPLPACVDKRFTAKALNNRALAFAVHLREHTG